MTEQAKTDLTVKPEVRTGGAISALAPQTLDDAFRLAKALAMSGDMVPKHFQGKPEMTMAAIVRGMEIGLAPMQALANIAVINGRASIWGDALPAVVQRAGHHLDVEVSGEGDKMIAVATLTRGDTGKTTVREFSVADAKKASLWGKQGPWQTYPKRMLSMRARAWAVRDGAADALMGLQVAEEVQDYQPIKDVTPKGGAFSEMANAARGRETPATAPESDQDAEVADTGVVDAETVPEPSYETLSVDNAFPGADQFTAGADAFDEGKPITDCPYDIDLQEAVDWCGGWRGAQEAKK